MYCIMSLESIGWDLGVFLGSREGGSDQEVLGGVKYSRLYELQVL